MLRVLAARYAPGATLQPREPGGQEGGDRIEALLGGHAAWVFMRHRHPFGGHRPAVRVNGVPLHYLPPASSG